jgi:spore coat polysaccharide biosynthesis predicted glycosyltransferase SpsG
MNILIVTTGDRQSGFGHIQRMSVLARELVKCDHRVEFVTLHDTSGAKRLSEFFPQGDYDTRVGITTLDNMGNISTYLKGNRVADLVLLDLEHGPPRNLLLHAKSHGRKVVVIGGVGFAICDKAAVNELVDLQIYQGVAVSSMNQDRSVRNMLVGPEYIILDEAYSQARQIPFGEREGVLISMGGSDPHNITSQVAYQVSDNYHKIIVLGPGVSANPKVISEWTGAGVVISPNSLAPLMASRKYLITALGMTVYEALCLGIPVACTAWSKDHEETAQWLFMRGYIQYLGLWDNINWEKLNVFLGVMQNEPVWRNVVEGGRQLVDGLGTGRVADVLEALNV